MLDLRDCGLPGNRAAVAAFSGQGFMACYSGGCERSRAMVGGACSGHHKQSGGGGQITLWGMTAQPRPAGDAGNSRGPQIEGDFG